MVAYILAGILGVLFLAEKIRSRKQYLLFETILKKLTDGEPLDGDGLKEGSTAVLLEQAKRLENKIVMEHGEAQEEKEMVKSLVSDMSHQLKTPLANIRLYQEILKQGGIEEQQQKLFWEKLEHQTEKLDWMLASLFKMVRLEQKAITFEAKPQKILETIQRAVESVYEKAEKRDIVIYVDIKEDQVLWHNRRWTAEVFENLLENAVKYANPGTKIMILQETYETYTEIHVKDEGRGIPKEEWNRIFQRFYRGKGTEDIEGSGIGLYLSRLILEMEQGALTVESEVGNGSCFTVFLQNCKNFSEKKYRICISGKQSASNTQCRRKYCAASFV